MTHAHKGGISHSPGQQFAAPKQRYAPPEWWFAFDWTAVAVSGAAARNFRSSDSRSPEQQSAASEAATRNFPSEAALCAPRRRRGLPPAFLRGRKVASSSQRFAGLRTRAVVRSLLAASPPSEQNREPPPPYNEKPAKRYEHLAGLREEDAAELKTRGKPNKRQNESGNCPQA